MPKDLFFSPFCFPERVGKGRGNKNKNVEGKTKVMVHERKRGVELSGGGKVYVLLRKLRNFNCSTRMQKESL